tara:strand:+ start:1072 stop:1440 length:369 start_codon:yes stop_codon:yes gene_type:complete
MDILLLFPSLLVEERYGNRKIGDVGGHLPPFGLACIAAYVRKQSFSVKIIDALADNLSIDNILVDIKKHHPKIIDFSAMTPQFLELCSLPGNIKTFLKYFNDNRWTSCLNTSRKYFKRKSLF